MPAVSALPASTRPSGATEGYPIRQSTFAEGRSRATHSCLRPPTDSGACLGIGPQKVRNLIKTDDLQP